MAEHEVRSEIEALRHETDPARLSEVAQEVHAADLAMLMETLSHEQRLRIFRVLDNAAAADLLDELEPDLGQTLLAEISLSRASDIIEEMPADEAADFLGDLPEGQAEAILGEMQSEDAEDIRELLDYEGDTAGGQMTTEFIAVTQSFTVEETIARLREVAPTAETVYYLYVVDEKDRLVGVASLRSLIVSDPHTQIAAIMSRDVISVPVNADQEDAADLIARYNLAAVPVIDQDGRPIGIVTVDDAVDVIDEEAAEAMHELAGGEDESPAHALPKLRSRLARSAAMAGVGLTAGLYLHYVDSAAPPGGIPGLNADSGWLAVTFLPAMLLLSWAFQGQALASHLSRMTSGSDRSADDWEVAPAEIFSTLLLTLIAGVVIALAIYVASHRAAPAILVGAALACGLTVSTCGAYVAPRLLAALGREEDSYPGGAAIVAHATGVLTFLGIAAGLARS